MHPTARSTLRRATCAALLLTQLTACMTWRPVPGTLAQQAGSEPIPRARLRFRSGTELTLREAMVSRDSIVGLAGNPSERRAFPLADVAAVERRQLSAGRTAGLVVGALAVTTIVAYGMAFSSLQKSINAVPAPHVP